MSSTLIDQRYELFEEISSGGMGSVWRGYDTVLDRPVAIKLIRVDQVVIPAQAEEFEQRFRREARVTARINHHGVPQVYDAVLDAGLARVYLVMELIDGRPLRDYIDPDVLLPISWVAAIAAQIATVLSHAHALPVVHRDLKPDNVLITGEGAVKVIDFGIAALLSPDAPKLTSTGQLIGTLRYMSPEKVQGFQVTPRSDLYALGCVMHEMACGSALFDSTSDYDMLRKHADELPTSLCSLRSDVPDDFERLVLDLVNKDPERRPPDAYTVYERLLPFLPTPESNLPPTPGLDGFPDPTRIFRRPFAPLEFVRVTTRHAAPAQPESTPVHVDDLVDALAAASKNYESLVDDERFAQAADALGTFIDPASRAFGLDSPKLLELRMLVAAAQYLGGDYRTARLGFEELASAYLRVEGHASAAAWECRAQVLRCQIALGDITGGLARLQLLLKDVVERSGDGSELALELRAELGNLLAASGDLAGARDVLEPLYEDLRVIRGSEDELATDVASALARLAAE